MKDEKKKKLKVLPESEPSKKVKKIDPQQEQEQKELFSKANEISPASKKIDKVEIVELRDGQIVNLNQYILENYTEKSTHFFYETFYFPIADLLGVSREIMKEFVKPLIVPLLKRLLIYGRFPNTIQQRLYAKNPYTGFCTRSQFNYQWLTQKADLQLRGFIEEFEAELQEALANKGDMKSFIKSYCEKFHVSVQLDIFENR